MGSALLGGWLESGLSPDDIVVVDPDPRGPLSPTFPSVVPAVAEIPESFIPTAVVFAVKPQTMDAVVPAYAGYTTAVFLSIAAGKPIAYFRERLGPQAAIVRAMPNTPAAVHRAISAAVLGDAASATQKDICNALLSAIGDVLWLNDESLMDAVTAVSGSGPAYVFLLTETLAAAGCRAGLPADVAARLARQTVIGAAELMRQSPEEEAATLRHHVTSPGGTTAAALAVLTAPGGLGRLMEAAVEAASRRAKELGG
jgi:pyrroline-5-carboxylate reductase